MGRRYGAVSHTHAAGDLHFRLCVIDHIDPSGHSVARSTHQMLQNSFFWPTMTVAVETTHFSCIYCVLTSGEEAWRIHLALTAIVFFEIV